MTTSLALRPIHYASVSGGKDSLYMLKVILEHPDKYPLDMVVNFDLEIDWPWTRESVDAIERMCDQLGIKFMRIKPRMKWLDQYKKWGIPTRQGRWCNSSYKLDCKRQLESWIKSQQCRPVAYIGICADETRRFKYKVGDWDPELEQSICYPLAEEGIVEKTILSWARLQQNFCGWYWLFDRAGCMMCPNLSMLELAYMLKFYPDHYNQFAAMILEYEAKGKGSYWHKPWGEIDQAVRTKHIYRLNQLIKVAEFSGATIPGEACR